MQYDPTIFPFEQEDSPEELQNVHNKLKVETETRKAERRSQRQKLTFTLISM